MNLSNLKCIDLPKVEKVIHKAFVELTKLCYSEYMKCHNICDKSIKGGLKNPLPMKNIFAFKKPPISNDWGDKYKVALDKKKCSLKNDK